MFVPVLYGFDDHPDGATPPPGELRLYYPSTDGAPDQACFLEGCARYPLVLFCHGHCAIEPDHYRKWEYLPASLARSGYVVAVPRFPGIEVGKPTLDPSTADYALAVDVATWLRTDWTGAASLANTTAVAGHSYGGLLAGTLAYHQPLPIAAYVSLSGAWNAFFSSTPPMLKDLPCPSFMMWGSSPDPGSGSPDIEGAMSDAAWKAVANPKHRITVVGARHWDYLLPGTIGCMGFAGECTKVGSLAGDFATTFLSKYAPPAADTIKLGSVSTVLIPPTVSLRPYEVSLGSGFLSAINDLPLVAPCAATHSWQPSPDWLGIPINVPL